MQYSFIIAIAIVFFTSSCGKKTQEAKPIRRDVTETVFASGILEAKNTYKLTTEADGYLTAINFEEGDVVSEGTLLAIVENKQSFVNTESATQLYNIAQSNTQRNAPALLQAQNSIELNKQKMEQDFMQYKRYQKLWSSNSVAKVDLENAELQYATSKTNYESAQENYRQLKQQAEQLVISNKASKNINSILQNNNQIRAVVSGKIYKKYKQPGDYVRKGDVIAMIGDAESIYAKVNIDEGNIEKVKVGQEAIVKLNTSKSKVYKGTVSEINPYFDESTQSFTCKIIINEPLSFTIVNTQLQSNIIVEQSKNALLIPSNYIDFGGNVQIKGRKEKTKVNTKFISNEWVQVLNGIDDNTLLVTDNIKENNIATSEVGSQMNK